MKPRRGFPNIALLALAGGLLAAVFLPVRAAQAQATVSTFTAQVSGSALPAATGLSEVVLFVGTVLVTTTVVTDPALPTGVVVSIDGRGLKGTGATTGKQYNNMAVANVTRLFAATDTIKTTFAFFENVAGSHLRAKWALLTLNLTYNTTTMGLTNVTGSVGTL